MGREKIDSKWEGNERKFTSLLPTSQFSHYFKLENTAIKWYFIYNEKKQEIEPHCGESNK